MKALGAAIYYDGLCLICSKEINHYRKLAGAEKFSFIDITDPLFSADSHRIDPFLVHKVMHVRDLSGRLHQGVDAFRAIWGEIPQYNFLHRWSENRWMRTALELGYKGFVKVRPFLPRRKLDCSNSPYCEIKND